jgi:hypothetical protein
MSSSLRVNIKYRQSVKIFPPSSAKVNMWNYTSTPPYVFMVWYLIKHRIGCKIENNWLHSLVTQRSPVVCRISVTGKLVVIT